MAIAIMQEIAKDRRMQEIKAERNNNNEPATDKQIAYLKKLGIKPKAGITKQEASELITQTEAEADRQTVCPASSRRI